MKRCIIVAFIATRTRTWTRRWIQGKHVAKQGIRPGQGSDKRADNTARCGQAGHTNVDKHGQGPGKAWTRPGKIGRGHEGVWGTKEEWEDTARLESSGQNKEDTGFARARREVEDMWRTKRGAEEDKRRKTQRAKKGQQDDKVWSPAGSTAKLHSIRRARRGQGLQTNALFDDAARFVRRFRCFRTFHRSPSHRSCAICSTLPMLSDLSQVSVPPQHRTATAQNAPGI